MLPQTIPDNINQLSYDTFTAQLLADYRMAVMSRAVSILGRKEVLTGKAKFGIFGDGKELAQIAWAKFFKPGDYRSGYYRDQTFMFASGLLTVPQFFAQLYADTNSTHEPMSSGRQMNGHYATRWVSDDGTWLPLAQLKNVSADMAPTAGQMPRALGLAYASKCFRNDEQLQQYTSLSTQGNEVCFATIGDASTSEGHFWETINAAGVLQIPLAVLVWDNGYGISVPKQYQTTKSSISQALAGMQQEYGATSGIDIYTVKGWDYMALVDTMDQAIKKCRATHTPCLIHVEEITQPQGHSTSGSHERYKGADRLEWEKKWDCIKIMKEWLLANAVASDDELNAIEQEATEEVKLAKQEAWQLYTTPIIQQVTDTTQLLEQLLLTSNIPHQALNQAITTLTTTRDPGYKDVLKAIRILQYNDAAKHNAQLNALVLQLKAEANNKYHTHLYNETAASALQVPIVPATYLADAQPINGYEVLNQYFDQLIASNPKVYAFGEDVGHIGDVNQGFAGLQEKHGSHRIFDTGIRETTIIGQGIGMAMRGLRPIAEIQYLDYLLYALQTLSDDVATLHYRTKGLQSCPLIVRTRGHRLEGIWHSGSPMGLIINALRGMYVCVPRNMTQAAGMYNTLLQSNDPGLVIECLNGYRLKEHVPTNLATYTVPLGVPEVLTTGNDVTVVSYGSTLRIVQDAAATLTQLGIQLEVIDVQTLLPFDLNHVILQSLTKTNRILIVDEDVPNGAAAYIYNQILEVQQGYKQLDVAARTLTAKAHRPPYGTDGDYSTKPNAEDVVEAVLEMMAE